MKIDWIEATKDYTVDVTSDDIEKLKVEAKEHNGSYQLAAWLIAKHYAFVGSKKFSAVKYALLSASGKRGGKKAAKIKREAKKEAQQLSLF